MACQLGECNQYDDLVFFFKDLIVNFETYESDVYYPSLSAFN